METLERILREHRLLEGLSEEHLRFMTGCARNVRYQAGDFLNREGDESSAMYLLRDGRVALEVHVPGRGVVQVDTLGEGDMVGWSWLVPPYRWELDARAVEPVRALAFDCTCLRAKMETDEKLGYALAKRFFRELYQRLERVRMQRLDVYKAEAAGW